MGEEEIKSLDRNGYDLKALTVIDKIVLDWTEWKGKFMQSTPIYLGLGRDDDDENKKESKQRKHTHKQTNHDLALKEFYWLHIYIQAIHHGTLHTEVWTIFLVRG